MPEIPSVGKTISIMQPYFIPYAGYFRLIAGVDLFVIYDCVQFPRRGWMHRNQLCTESGETDWLTMPLKKAPRDMKIRDLRFRESARDELEKQIRRFPALKAPPPHMKPLVAAICDPQLEPLDYIVNLMRIATEMMGLTWRVARSSDLGLPDNLRAQDRILAIAKAYDAKRYINPPGGRHLYEHAAFSASGIDLRFLPDYVGSYVSIAERLSTEDPVAVAAEIRGGTEMLE